VEDKVIRGLSETYGRGKGLIALIGSHDCLEIALKDGSAAARLRARAGDKVKIRKRNP
jgi:S-adenosylmethionine hydrolase